MKEERLEDSSPVSKIDPLTRRTLRDLAALVRAQSRVMEDLIQLFESPDETPKKSDLEKTAVTADTKGRDDASAPAGFAGGSQPVEAEASARGNDSEDDPAVIDDPFAEPGTSEIHEVVAEQLFRETEPALPDPLREAIEAAPAGGEIDEEEGQAEDATVLVLESGNARVGVLWDQVTQVGTLSEPGPPDRVESQDGFVDLVSLGSVLHGVSREERSFVVLADGDERIAVACERMAGLGPLASAMRGENDERIQVLEVALLKTFAAGARGQAAGTDIDTAARAARRHEEDVRDRNGPLRALVAVRYLPARVAICRFLRGRGWQVGEAAGLEAAIVSLDLGHWDALFLEARTNGDPDDAEQALMDRVGELKVPVVRVGSRISGYPTQGGPSLIFPFSETELEAIVASVGIRGDG